ncbi:ATP-binding protein [Leisingera sp. NJS204]|uniref:ATP-binding protein n=1 Tax=Leisingera sp. NJS204 TaxID=2508307 RepID=UPI00101345A7|nr:ATP-binding protein [Leisingera sp. NJS204]QAX28774.1 hypothetical protein ETW24_04995 [Leisingera sp. NJS204]
MLPHPTLDRLKALRLDGMAEAFAELQAQDSAAGLTHAEWLGLLADREAASRETKRFDARMRAARLRHVGACPEDVDYRARRGSTMITSQLPIKAWHDVIGEPTFADAILDRIVHNAYRLQLEGQSMRKTIAKMDDGTP